MTALATPGAPVRRRITVAGVVQGVGFRPFLHRLASELDLAGHVGNDTEGVFVEVEGRAPDVEQFESRLVDEAPPLAMIDHVQVERLAPSGERGFRIVASRAALGGDSGRPGRTFVSPDVAVCDDCLAELLDPADRRYRYPFVNCTHCGPRFTITERLPYDRAHTTMRGFTLCSRCSAEYHDPADRRFHAQPVACSDCGPRIWYEGAGAVVDGTDAALLAAHEALARGEVVAVKGLGGYHLACDATCDAAVERLRRRKNRAEKPFAIMVADLATAESLAFVGTREAALLTSYQRPIVLMRRLPESSLATFVAPDNPYVGLLLAHTPLHHLLLLPVPGTGLPAPSALVMTSGNLSDEPICYDDADARQRLGRIADAWLVHDRPIHVPCDDSVVRVEQDEELPIRRSRGYAPVPVRLPFDVAPLVAAGGELKNTFCLASGRDAWMSQHIGDMGSVETLHAFERSRRQFAEIYAVQPELVAADAHPGYQTRRWAEDWVSRTDESAPDDAVRPAVSGTCQVELVQHHHAHVAAVMVEHGVPPGERVIGYAFDGTGYGTDGAIWGGEVLVAGYDSFVRAAHLRYVPLPGGDAAVRKPYRAALAHLWAAGIGWAPDLPPVAVVAATELAVIERQLERGVNCVATSSMGRLFDAISSLLGVRHVASYEAQAAIELETVAAAHLGEARDYRFDVEAGEIMAAPVLQAMVEDIRDGCPAGAAAAGFHVAAARLIAESALVLQRETGIGRVALSGGVFQNALLVRLARDELRRNDLQVLTHRLVPPNDGGLALGQAAVAGRRRRRGEGTAIDSGRGPEETRW